MITPMLTDFYELTMLQSALEDDTANKPAVFELFTRRLPKGRQYGVVAGTERAIKAIQEFRFTTEHIAWFKENTELTGHTLDYLKNYRFTGTVTGLREGDLYFPNSPILTVEGTFGDSVLLETLLLSIFNYDSAVASSASRMVQAAQQKDYNIPLIEMGSRRTNELAAPAAARATYLTGFTATSNTAAGFMYNVPVTGTSAHAYTLAHDSEITAFNHQIAALGESTTLLVDTYNIEQGIQNALTAGGKQLGGVRIDSGDLYEETLQARKQLDAAGNTDSKIILSSDIDEYVIQELIERDTPVDGLGIGTRVVTGSGHPTAGMVYKLVSIESNGVMKPVAKNATGKASVGGKKRTYRCYDTRTEYITVDTEDTTPTDTVTFIEQGETVFCPSLEDSRTFHQEIMRKLSRKDRSIQYGNPILTPQYN